MNYQMKYIIDRIEERKAVLERDDATIVNVSVNALPDGVKEGDCLLYSDGEYTIDEAATSKRKEHIDSLVDELFV